MAEESNITRLDRFGRIKLPSAFRRAVEKSGEGEVFVSSTDDRTFEIYPLAIWHARVDKLLKERKKDPLLRLFFMKANYNGQVARIDRFRRVQIPSLLRKRIRLEGRINVEEREGHLELRPDIP